MNVLHCYHHIYDDAIIVDDVIHSSCIGTVPAGGRLGPKKSQPFPCPSHEWRAVAE